MVAQHLPRDLIRPNSGLKELAQTMKNNFTRQDELDIFINLMDSSAY